MLTLQIERNGNLCKGSTLPRHAWPRLIWFNLDPAASPAYIAGVTNPIFESTGLWDLLCDVAGGRMVVSKDIHSSHPPSGTQAGLASTLARSGTLRAESSIGSEDDLGRLPGREKEASKSDFTAKADNADNVFIEDVGAQDGSMEAHLY